MTKQISIPSICNLVRLVTVIYCLCGFSALSFTTNSFAADPFAPQVNTTTSSNLKGSALVSNDADFLPVADAFRLQPKIDNYQLLLRWDIAEGYYLYEERFKFRTPDTVKITPQYTQGKMKYDDLFERDTMVHVHQVTVSFDLTGITQAFELKLEHQGCAFAGLCYPPQKMTLWVDPVSATVSTNEITAVAKPDSTNVSTTNNEADYSWLLQALFLAILGGIILNLMPCVFPVLSIKVMSLAAADKDRLVIHGWAYTAGIVLCFVSFALVLILARKGGEAIGWGFQLQSPGLIAALAYLFFVMGLSMSGLIHFGGNLMGAGQQLTEKSGLTGSFFTGILAAVVASPCTAPFMGTALGFALTQPLFVCIVVFAALGLGMALPLLLLCYVPALAARLPKPGAWMDNLKQLLAFPLYLSSIWLLWVYGRQTSVNQMAVLCSGAVALAFGCWMLSRSAEGVWLWMKRISVMASLLVATYLAVPQDSSANKARWQTYSPELLQSLRADGRPVFVNLTADWCLTCLANERVALHTETLEQVFDELNVATLKGDWTNADPEITALLTEYGRSGVPLYLWFPAHHQGKATILPQLLTADLVISTIKNP